MSVVQLSDSETAMLATALYYKTGLEKQSSENYKEYKRISDEVRNRKSVNSFDFDKVKTAIEQFLGEIENDTLHNILDKLGA